MDDNGEFRAEVTGEVAPNGTPISLVQQQHSFGYVMQDDAFSATETPREFVDFSARPRLLGVDEGKIFGCSNDLLEALGLSGCADTVAGNEMIRGISGGLRTSIGA